MESLSVFMEKLNDSGDFRYMGSRSSRLGHDLAVGLILWVYGKAVHQMGHGWWRLHFDDNRCKRMMSRGLQVAGGAQSIFPGVDGPTGFAKEGFNPKSLRIMRLYR